MKNTALIFSLFLLAACAAPVAQMYEGPTRSPSEQVVLRVEQRGRTFAGERVDIQLVDDKRTLGTGEGIFSSSSGAQAVYLLPGKHTVRLRYRGPGAAVTSNLWFVGEAGGSYLVRGAQVGDGVQVWIEDEKTGNRVGGVRGSADEPK
jgi:hypothetical protein